tara:strand:- start:15132 stop:15368 length:237 start_codon:yes stop_codon:yes gene_type:complete
MKTLVKPQVKLVKEISYNRSYRQNRLESCSFQYRKFNKKWKILLIAMSFFTFIAFPDSPEIDAEICNRFNSQIICNMW